MENQKILNLLNEAKDFKHVTRKWNLANDTSKKNYDVDSETIYNNKVLEFYLCDYNGAYISVRANITIGSRYLATQLAFKNCAPFAKCRTTIDGTTIDDAVRFSHANVQSNRT